MTFGTKKTVFFCFAFTLANSASALFGLENFGFWKEKDLQKTSKSEEACMKATHLFRFAWCDALRGELTPDEWKMEGAKYLASTMTTVSNDPPVIINFNNRDEYLDAETGSVKRQLDVFGQFEACLSFFGTNWKSTYDKKSKMVTVTSPVSKFYEVNGTKVQEYDMDTYQCIKEKGEWKVANWKDTQTIFLFDTSGMPGQPGGGGPPGTGGNP